MKYLLDTCVISELRHPKGSVKVKKYIQEIPEESLFLSVISIGEITKGINNLSEGQRKRDLNAWLMGIENFYQDRVLAIDIEVAQIWGEISAKAKNNGAVLPVSDGLIAATALKNGLHLLTRNVADFVNTGAMIVNPWD